MVPETKYYGLETAINDFKVSSVKRSLIPTFATRFGIRLFKCIFDVLCDQKLNLFDEKTLKCSSKTCNFLVFLGVQFSFLIAESTKK